MLQSLREINETKEVALTWQSVYTWILAISNRKTSPHHDSKGRPEWYDILLSYSGSCARPQLLIKDVGLDLKYSSGSVVGFCGSIFEHEVSSWGIGDRACYAHFMRESVRKRLDAPLAGWVNKNIYLPSWKMPILLDLKCRSDSSATFPIIANSKTLISNTNPNKFHVATLSSFNHTKPQSTLQSFAKKDHQSV